MAFILRGRRSIWSGVWVMPVVPRIVNDVSYVRRINHEIYFAWQAQYLVRCEAAAGLAPLHVWLHRTSYQEVLVNKKFLAVAATLISF